MGVYKKLKVGKLRETIRPMALPYICVLTLQK